MLTTLIFRWRLKIHEELTYIQIYLYLLRIQEINLEGRRPNTQILSIIYQIVIVYKCNFSEYLKVLIYYGRLELIYIGIYCLIIIFFHIKGSWTPKYRSIFR